MTPEDGKQFFPLGGDAVSRHALNLDTGEIVSAETLAVDAGRTIPAPAICPASLREAFTEAGYESSYDKDGDLLVDHPATNVNILVEARNKCIWFISAFTANELVDMDVKYAFANRLNDRYHMVRFLFPTPTTFVADYVMSYKQGVVVTELVAILERFAGTIAAALSENDDLDIIT